MPTKSEIMEWLIHKAGCDYFDIAYLCDEALTTLYRIKKLKIEGLYEFCN